LLSILRCIGAAEDVAEERGKMHEQDVSRIVDGAANRLKRKSLAGLQTRKYYSGEAAGGPAGGGTRREKVEGERGMVGNKAKFFSGWQSSRRDGVNACLLAPLKWFVRYSGRIDCSRREREREPEKKRLNLLQVTSCLLVRFLLSVCSLYPLSSCPSLSLPETNRGAVNPFLRPLL